MDDRNLAAQLTLSLLDIVVQNDERQKILLRNNESNNLFQDDRHKVQQQVY